MSRPTIALVLAGVLIAGLIGVASARSSARHAAAGVTVRRDLAYGTAVDNLGRSVRLTLDVYQLSGAANGARPAIVWAHGGGFQTGTKRTAPMVALAEAFARRGWIAASIDYRLRPLGTPGWRDTPSVVADAANRPGPIILDARLDMQAAVRWVRANASSLGVDPDRIVVGGYSAGAIMAIATDLDPLATADSRVAAAVSIAGVGRAARPADAAGPILMFHGTADDVVPYALGARTCAQVEVALGTCHMVTFPGDGHDLATKRLGRIVDDAIAVLCAGPARPCPA